MKKLLTAVILLFCLTVSAACGAEEPIDPSALADGSYQVEVTMEGGSGKASIASPAELTVSDGQLIATIVWSSPYYVFMEVDGVQYDPVTGADENSTFEIPVTLDTDVPVKACTIAMSEPHVIDYTLHFDSTTIQGD